MYKAHTHSEIAAMPKALTTAPTSACWPEGVKHGGTRGGGAGGQREEFVFVWNVPAGGWACGGVGQSERDREERGRRRMAASQRGGRRGKEWRGKVAERRYADVDKRQRESERESEREREKERKREREKERKREREKERKREREAYLAGGGVEVVGVPHQSKPPVVSPHELRHDPVAELPSQRE